MRRFTDENGWLYAVNRSNTKAVPFRCKPNQLFVRKEYYTEVDSDGSKNSRMELRLSQLESEISPILAKFMAAAEANKLPDLSRHQKSLWDKFFLLQYRRVPDLRDDDSWKNALEEYAQITSRLKKEFPHRVEEIEAFESDEEKIRMVNNAYVNMLDLPPGEPEKVLNRRGIILLRSARNKKFVIGSRPVIQMNMKNGRTLHDSYSEMWLPIASNLAIGVGTMWEKEKILDLENHSGMRYLNEAIARNSTSFASASLKLTQSIAMRC
ncbi:DUF4238 domain-containing protein [Parasphingorhabdus halotolerans]|uniref:DUF4238 domain-containing protein n=1 Tax=Parasphingorhabdus halotolerans TaxID=2725558 RepID=A0A6H2DMJ9_9SPHN|nr:DUF4238 domain-containing protein [Parasphingorhabdus halotolerans]QJB69357.1 DUF4238 domain-containing protein [Parasphingorhabdus halotolerans]